MEASGDEDEDEMLRRAIAMSLEEHSGEEEGDMFISNQLLGELLVQRPLR